MVLTLVVVPAMGAWVAVTEPDSPVLPGERNLIRQRACRLTTGSAELCQGAGFKHGRQRTKRRRRSGKVGFVFVIGSIELTELFPEAPDAQPKP